MRQMCQMRDRLWADYGAAVDVYTKAISKAAPWDADRHAYIADAKARMHSRRAEIWQHCAEHGCGPEYVERFR